MENIKQWKNEYDKCKDPVYFYSHYLKIKDKNGNWVVPPDLTDKQKHDMRIYSGYLKDE